MNIALAVPIGLLPISAKSSCSAKLVKACTSLNISDTEYVFKTTREVAEKNLIKGQSEYEIRYEYSAWGSLNRINGKFDATEHFSSSDWTRWQMTCASPQGKSK
jgi:hypothetical protein